MQECGKGPAERQKCAKTESLWHGPFQAALSLERKRNISEQAGGDLNHPA